MWAHGVEGTEATSRIGMAVRMTETALWDMSSVDHSNFIPEYRKCGGLESLGTNLNLL